MSEQQTHQSEQKECVWGLFDAAWYRRRYRHVLSEQEREASDTQLEELWREEGVRRERSPNRYFDESWYLRRNDSVMRSVHLNGIFESGFQHYRDIGYRHNSPHWLFDPEEYFRHNTNVGLRHILKEGYINGYDYFIKKGDLERQDPHPFFQQDLFISECLQDGVPFDFNRGAFSQYLSLEHAQLGRVRTTWYFDPKWYLERYPEVQEQIENGQYVTPLHHYLCCEQPQNFDPNPYFSESYYLTHYPDVKEAIDLGIFRNGYAHFMASGVHERRQPCEAIDLATFVKTLPDASLTAALQRDDAFVLWIKKEEGLLPSVPDDDASRESYKNLAIGHVTSMLPAMFRSPLRFPTCDTPSLSVVILSEGDDISVIASLVALHEQNVSNIDVIVASHGNKVEKRYLAQCTEGVTLLYPSPWRPLEGLLAEALGAVRSDKVVVMHAGVQPLLGALNATMALLNDPHIHAGAGQIVGVDGRVLEAGCRVWRHGKITPCGRGEVAHAPGIGYAHDVEAVQQGFFIVRREALEKALPLVGACGLSGGFSPIALAVRSWGYHVRYRPDILVRDLETYAGSEQDRAQQEQRIKRNFSRLLQRHALPDGGDQQAPKIRPTMVMIFPHIPRKEEGAPTRRIFHQIDALQRQGWEVTVVGLRRAEEDRLTIPVDYPINVECLVAPDDMAAFFRQRRGKIQALWLNGTQVLSALSPIMQQEAASLPARGIILDVVTQDGGGLRAMEAHLRRLVGHQNDDARLRREAAEELSSAWLCQCIIAGDQVEAQLMEELGYDNVAVLPLPIAAPPHREEKGFSERHGLLFPLCIYRSGDAAHDGFDWFCLHVVSQLRDFLPEEIPMWISGYHHPSVDLGFYERFVTLEGLTQRHPDDVLMQQCRVSIAPTRALATQASEMMEGALCGVPSVVSEPLMQRLGWSDHCECLNGGFSDTRRFAKAIAELYQNEALWKNVRDHARERVEKENTIAHFQKVLAEILSMALGEDPIETRKTPPHDRPHARRFEPAPLHYRPIGGRRPPQQPDRAASSDDEEGLDDDEQDIPLQTRLGVQLDQ